METIQYLDVLGTPLSVGDRVWTHYRGRIRILRLCVILGRRVFYYANRRDAYDYTEFCHKPAAGVGPLVIDKIVAPELNKIRLALLQEPHSIDAMRLKLKLPVESRNKTKIALEMLRNAGELMMIGNEYCYRHVQRSVEE